MSTWDGTGEQTDMTGTSFVTVFFLLSSFLFLTFTICFVANYSNRQGGAEWDGTQHQTGRGQVGRNRTGRRARRQGGRGAGEREEEVGEGRKTDSWGTWGQLRLKTRRMGGRASQSGGRATWLLSCLRLGYLVKAWTFFPLV